MSIIIYPGFQCLEAMGAISVFSYANRQLRQRGNPKRYNVEIVSLTAGNVTSDTGIALRATRSLATEKAPNTAVIVGADHIETAVKSNRAIVEWCATVGREAKRLAALCSGSFFLAEAGLLDGKRATTHWGIAGLMRQKYPQIRVEDDSIFTCTGNIWTSAGVSTAVDLALAFVEEDCGRQIALDLARELVVFMKRPGGQSQCSTSLVSQMTAPATVGDVQSWVLENLNTKITVEEMARHACMGLRHFTRVFRKRTGLSPARFVEHARIEMATRLLQDSNLPMKTIAFRCGFVSDEQMRKVFKKRLSITAREYRKRHSGAPASTNYSDLPHRTRQVCRRLPDLARVRENSRPP